MDAPEPVESGSPSVSLEEEESKWPTVIGVLSIIYAALGLLCQFGAGLMTWINEWMMKNFMDVEVTMPAQVKMVQTATIVVMSILGIVLLMGGIALVKRRRQSLALLKSWVLLRLVAIPIMIVIGYLHIPTNIAFQKEIREQAIQNAAEQQGSAANVPPFNEEQARRWAVITLGAMSGAQALFPLFLGFYLSRRRITDEVSKWT